MISRSISPSQILKNDENFRTFQARSRDILGGMRSNEETERGGGVGGLGRPILRFDPFERFEKHGFFFQTFKIQIKVISFFQKDYCTGEAPPYGHLIINTVTSQPLSIGRLAKRLNFSSKNTSLIRSPVNTAKCFFCFLATENSIHFKLYSKTKGYTKKEQCVPSCLSSTRGSVIRPL